MMGVYSLVIVFWIVAILMFRNCGCVSVYVQIKIMACFLSGRKTTSTNHSYAKNPTKTNSVSVIFLWDSSVHNFGCVSRVSHVLVLPFKVTGCSPPPAKEHFFDVNVMPNRKCSPPFKVPGCSPPPAQEHFFDVNIMPNRKLRGYFEEKSKWHLLAAGCVLHVSINL